MYVCVVVWCVCGVCVRACASVCVCARKYVCVCSCGVCLVRLLCDVFTCVWGDRLAIWVSGFVCGHLPISDNW